MSYPVSSFSTVLIISTGKRRLARFLGDSLSWLTVAQDNIASCATERKLGFLLRVIWAGPSSRESVAFVAKRGDILCGSTLGSAGMGWSILLYLINLGDRLGASTLGAMMLGCTTLGENTGRGGGLVGSLPSARIGGRAITSMWPFLLTLLDICCEKGLCVALTLGSGVAKGGNGEAADSEKISLRRVRSASGDCCKHAGIVPFSAEAIFPAAVMTASAGVTLVFEIYLCLWNTVSEILVARVFIIQNFHAR